MNNEKIYIKAHFGDWREVSKEKARDFIKGFRSRIQAVAEEDKNSVCQKHVKGITVEELLKED